MVRGARDALLPLLRDFRALSTSSAAAQLAPVTKSTSGPLSWFFGGGSRPNVPLSEPLPDLVVPKPDALPAKSLSVQSSSLANGAKVAAVDALGPLGGVGVFVNAGSANETASNAGASFLLSQFAFRATTNRTTFRLARELDKIGGVASAKAGREVFSLGLKVNKLHLPEAVEIVMDVALNPRFNHWELNESLPFITAALEEALSNPANTLYELLHKAAYSGSLGNSLLPDPSALDTLTPDVLHEFHAAHFHAGNMVLVGAGVDLEKFQTLAQPLLPSSGAAVAPSAISKYVGGFVNLLAPIDTAHVAIAFEVSGGKSSAKTAATAAVAAAVLDSNKTAVPYLEAAAGALASSQPLLGLYKDTGLLGVSATSAPADSSKALDAISAAFTKVAKGVSDAELLAAKGKALRALSDVTAVATTVEDIGTQISATGAFSAGALPSAIASVTAADVSGLVAKALKTPPTIVSYGKITDIPRYSDITKRFA